MAGEIIPTLRLMTTNNFNASSQLDCTLPVSDPIKLADIYFTNSTLRELELETIRSVDYFNALKVLNSQQVMRQSFDVLSRAKLLKEKFNNNDASLAFFIKLIEDVLITSHFIMTAKSKLQYTMAVINFVKLRTPGPLISTSAATNLKKVFDEIFGKPEIQSDDMFTTAREYLDKFKEVKNALVFKKIYKFAMYLLSASLFENIGLTFDTLQFNKLEAEAIRCKHNSKIDFIECILDTSLFLCERGYQCIKTGSMDPIMHSQTAYTEWCEKAQKLKLDFIVLGNPDPHSVNPFAFGADLDDSIAKGEAIYKHAKILGDFEKKIIYNLLNDLKLLKVNFISKRSAQKKRTTPFSVLIYGGSSVAKSKFTEMLFFQYGKLFDLPTDDEFMYTRSAVDPFWSGWATSSWCILMDDVAFMHPNIASNGDPTLMELIQVINDVAFVPNQAELADKGKTPVRAKFVMATTNAEHMNAYAYFSSPLALQRRLPFIIDIVPKPMYTRDNVMIDSYKLPILKDGEYPDFWDITVKRVVPTGGGRDNQKATSEVIGTYSDVRYFLQWFSKAARDHEVQMAKAKACTKSMSLTVLCKTCDVPSTMCLCPQIQAEDEVQEVYVLGAQNQPESSWNINSLFEWVFSSIFLWFYGFYYIYVIISYTLSFGQKIIFVHRLVGLITNRISNSPQLVIAMAGNLGNRIENKIGKVTLFKAIAGFIASGSALYVALKIFKNFATDDGREEVRWVSVEGKDRPIVESPPVKDEIVRENVWMKEDNEVTSFDVSPLTKSYKGIPFDTVKTMILDNCIFARVRTGEFTTKPTKAVALGGHIYLFNKHALPIEGDFKVEIIRGISSPGINSNIGIMLSQTDIVRYPNDLCVVNIRDLPPRKDITNLFCSTTLSGIMKGVYVGRNEDGSSIKKNVQAISKVVATTTLGTIKSWKGKVDVPTVNGDCGAVMLANTDFGPIILGIHYLGGEDDVFSINVDIDFAKDALNMFQRTIGSAVPNIQSTSVKRGLVELHYKSPVRYVENGCANVYGSFTGWRAKLKSRVEPTYISKIVEKAGYNIKYGKPCLDWRPWNKALVDMVQPSTEISSTILDECVTGFTREILYRLPKGELKKIHVYDTFTAINGANGVAYVDKINRSTSAGCPWKKSKKYFEEAIEPQQDLLDPIMYNREIMDRVDLCIDQYLSGNRYAPVFCGNCKDEARSFSKIAEGNTRVFAGAPLDWTIVVRKYLLSFIRVVQNNRFIFESAPGTIAQSTEWEQIRSYLVLHGSHQIIAGDYGKFDKKMCSKMVLAAFKVISNICEEAGYTSEQLLVIQGIAEDTAFPFMDFNGDLIEFFGSNPSGHPLTVIINGIANCLYMRYAYHVLNPVKHCFDFKTYVNLITYGDDNSMGVSRLKPWFNHTSIQRTLANIGVKYTMADKEAESVPYIHISECSFLKRSWRFDDDVNAYLCPLDHDSIEKMLTIGVKSKAITEEAHAIAVISTALREYFFYGKKVFNEKRIYFQSVVVDAKINNYVTESTFPTWDELNDKFWRNSYHVKLGEFEEDDTLPRE